jgi:two-component system KDP operon response regulator KdpE
VANLAANGLRYSPTGEPPHLTTSRLGKRVEIRVIDRGPGSPPDDWDRIFLPFQRLGDTDNTTGIGLGLALSRGLTEAMGGTLEPEETPGGGLTMVDDEPRLLRASTINLRARHYEVRGAASATQALTAAAAQPPDLVILDLGLPDMDGTHVIAGLRGWTDVPMLVLSGRTDSQDKVEAFDAGAEDYATKPFGIDELLARLRAMTRRGGDNGEQPVRFGDATVDLATRRVTRGKDDVRLTPTEWHLLEVLVRHPGKLLVNAGC